MLSMEYKRWNLPYDIKPPPELTLPRAKLQRLLAIRTAHGDFTTYHTRFKHENATMKCSCGRAKTPLHLVFCTKVRKSFSKWPGKLHYPPRNSEEGMAYLKSLFKAPDTFAELLNVSEFYSRICL